MGSKPTMFIIPNLNILPKNESEKWEWLFTGKISFYITRLKQQKKTHNGGSLIACAGHTLEKINRSCHT